MKATRNIEPYYTSVCATDGEVGLSVKQLPFGFEDSNSSIPTDI